MKIAIVVTARPSWTKLSSLCAALKQRPDVELQIVACASALLERYGRVVDVIEQEGYAIAAECWSTLEGENLVTAVRETGVLCTSLADVLHRVRPDIGVVVADRHEVLAAAQAVAYLHIPLVHLQGGERTGSIDDKVRDSITQLADYHFVCTTRAAMRVYALTGSPDRIWALGCPSIDLAKQALSDPPVTAEELGGAGAPIDLSQPFLVVLQHPVTNEADEAGAQMRITLEATREQQRLVLWSGQDAGSGAMAKAIRMESGIHTLRNLPPKRFLRLMAQCAAIVGNSSASVRECSFIGTPAVLIGTRQHGREIAQNVIRVPHEAVQIRAAIKQQIAHGRYPSSHLYGSGHAGARIAEVICSQLSLSRPAAAQGA